MIARDNYSQTIRAVTPGFVIAMMFLVTSIVFSSHRKHEVSLNRLTLGVIETSGAIVPANAKVVLRELRTSNTEEPTLLPVGDDQMSIRGGFRRLVDSAQSMPIETITLEIPSSGSPQQQHAQHMLRQELVRLLSRRMNSLALTILLRTSAENVQSVTELLANIQKSTAIAIDRIAIQSDPEVQADGIVIEVTRSIRLVPSEESVR